MRAIVHGGHSRRADLRVPGDKSISHRALLFSLISEGTSRIDGLSRALDVGATRVAIECLGAKVIDDSDAVFVVGVGGEFTEPERIIDVGNSGTLLRLITGVLAGSVGNSFFLSGDASIVRRPMQRVVEPLGAMGATIVGRGLNQYAPLAISGQPLVGITYSMSLPSAQVKSALMFAGLFAEGETVLIEQNATRAHTEEMAVRYGAKVSVDDQGDAKVIRVTGSRLKATDFVVPGDPSAAAFFVVLGLIGQSQIRIEDVYLGPQRDGFVDVLLQMGAQIEVMSQTDSLFTIVAHPSDLTWCDVGPSKIAGLIDEIPILAVAASRAKGRTRFLGVDELRHKESDRIATTLAMLKTFDVHCSEIEGGFEVEGTFTASKNNRRIVESHFDHRIAMSAAILASLHKGKTEITGFESVSTSFPGFADRLRECGIRTDLKH